MFKRLFKKVLLTLITLVCLFGVTTTLSTNNYSQEQNQTKTGDVKRATGDTAVTTTELEKFGITFKTVTFLFSNTISSDDIKFYCTTTANISTKDETYTTCYSPNQVSVKTVYYKKKYWFVGYYNGRYTVYNSDQISVNNGWAVFDHTNSLYCKNIHFMYFPNTADPASCFAVNSSGKVYFKGGTAVDPSYFSSSGMTLTASSGSTFSIADHISASNITKTYSSGMTVNLAETLTRGTAGSYKYTSYSTDICTISNSSNSTGTIHKPGTALIKIEKSASGFYNSSSTTYILTINKMSDSIAFSSSQISATYGDLPITLSLSRTGAGSGGISYTSSNKEVGSISGSQLTIKNVGSSTITASKDTSTYYSECSTTTTLVVSKKTIDASNFTCSATDLTYEDTVGSSTISPSSFDVTLPNGNKETVTGTW